MSDCTACKRREFILGAAGLGLAWYAGCRPAKRSGQRIGCLSNLSHAVPIVGHERRMLGKSELVPFNAGPSAIEALLAGDLDYCYAGPGPSINAFVRSKGRVRILAGAASGGAALVMRAGLAVTKPEDLEGRRLATPQLGNTQDIALRKYLQDHDLATRDRGGKVTVIPMANADALSMMRSHEIDGAWMPEPWASRLVEEAGGTIFVDEAALWPGGRFPTTLLVTTEAVRKRADAETRECVRANRRIIDWIRANPLTACSMVDDSLAAQTGQRLSPPVLAAAWKRLTFGDDPMIDALRAEARAARAIGYLPSSDIEGIVAAP